MPTPAATVATAISEPASAASDGQSATNRSANDVIALLNYDAILTYIGKRRRGIRYQKATNPGCLDDQQQDHGANFAGGL